ncbi:hypothetical protein K7G98_08745 [Saccharothrix sp. MB29]|nr:hypothetical protein [Saccharothrix sp. MB29]
MPGRAAPVAGDEGPARTGRAVRRARRHDRPGQPHLLAAYTTEKRADFGGPQTYAKFGYRPGATEHLTVLEGGAKDGLWVPRCVADTIGVRVGGRGMGGRLPPVTAIYEDLRDPLPDWWCSERHHVVPNALDRDELASAVVWLPTFESFTALPHELTTATDVTVRFPADVPATVAGPRPCWPPARNACGRSPTWSRCGSGHRSCCRWRTPGRPRSTCARRSCRSP